MSDDGDVIERLSAENAALKRALRLLFDVANLVRAVEDAEATAYAILTAVTAGVGLGMNRAMIFEVDPERDEVLVGRAAVGPATREEADRVWRSIEAEQPDLETLHEAGIRQRTQRAELDFRVRATEVRIDSGRDAVSLGASRLVLGEGEDDLRGLLHPPTTLAAPMRGREGLRGVLVADNRWTGRVPDPVVRQVFAMVADHAGRALFAAERFERVQVEARVDALTGLDARRVGLALLEHASRHAFADGRSLSLLLLDVDHFKTVNDTHGHPVGDVVLAEIGRRIRASLERGERAFRYGGEEIGIVLEGAKSEDAVRVAERVRSAIALVPIEVGGGPSLTVTCSLGVATTPPWPADAGQLLRAADDALLLAKRSGRDRVARA